MATEDRIGMMVVSETDRVFEVEVADRGKFRLRIPYPVDRASIGNITSQLVGGAPLTSVAEEDLARARILATLSIVIVDKPEWFDVQKCLDEELLVTLFSKWQEKDREFREKLKKNQFFRKPPVPAGA